MQCGCPVCGQLMAKVERGLESVCLCPDCGTQCHACLGGQRGADRLVRRGLTPEDWERLLRQRDDQE